MVIILSNGMPTDNNSEWRGCQNLSRRLRIAITPLVSGPVTALFLVEAMLTVHLPRYFALTARQRTTQKAESGMARSMPRSGPRTIAQKKKEKITPA